MSEKSERTQVEADNNRRHHGQLREHSFLKHHGKFDTTDVHAGTVFSAELQRLLKAVEDWDKCRAAFNEKLERTTLATRIPDGSGPVAHAVGARFNYRIGTPGGVGYAAHAYLRRLEQILQGLIQTAENYAKVDEHINAALTNGVA